MYEEIGITDCIYVKYQINKCLYSLTDVIRGYLILTQLSFPLESITLDVVKEEIIGI